MEEAQRADEEIDISTDVTRYKEAVDSLAAAMSACVTVGPLPETEEIAKAARELMQRMQAKVAASIESAKRMLLKAISTAKETRESAPLALCLSKLFADDVLRLSFADEVESAENLVTKLKAKDKQLTPVGILSVMPTVCLRGSLFCA